MSGTDAGIEAGVSGSGSDAGRDVSDMEAEVLAGLPHDRERLAEARLAQEYYDLAGPRRARRRPGESSREFEDRPKRGWPVLHAAVNALTAHLYNPGPVRRLEGDAGGEAFLQGVWERNQINALMQAADVAATLHGAAAIGVHATGRPEFPIRLDLYGGDEFAVWTPRDDPARPSGFCALSHDRRTGVWHYELWTASERRTYEARGGGRPERTGRSANPYGTLPFAFAHHRLVTRDFWEGGLGEFLRRANEEIDRELSDLAQIGEYDVPIGFLRDAAPGTRLSSRPGHFNHLQGRTGADRPEPFYLSANYDHGGRLEAIERHARLILEFCGAAPERSSWRGDSGREGGRSGLAVMAERLPLLTRARRRQVPFGVYEEELTRLILECAGRWYKQPRLLRAARRGRPRLQWPEPALPLPIPERDRADRFQLEQGLASRVTLAMNRHGLTREQALELLEQVREDRRAFGGPGGGSDEGVGDGEGDGRSDDGRSD